MSRERWSPPINPPGFLATQDLKARGWTPAMIQKFLGEHDDTRLNGLKMGRRRLPPVKLYREERVNEAEREDDFLAAQARAADARERAARARETREARRAALLRSAAGSYVPTVHPEPLRKGATRKAREPYLAGLERTQSKLEREIAAASKPLGERETAQLRALLLEQLDLALSQVYDWFPAPGEQKQTGAKKKPKSQDPQAGAQVSDWREWDWD